VTFLNIQTALNTPAVMWRDQRETSREQSPRTSKLSNPVVALNKHSTVPFLDILWQRQWGPGRHFKFEIDQRKYYLKTRFKTIKTDKSRY